MEAIEKTKEKLSFVSETNESLANAIRRSCNEVLSVAIDEIEISKNDSALYDEIVAHRIGLIPLEESRKLNLTENCTCKGKGCSKCQVQLSVKIKGPKTVYSGDLKGDCKVVYDKMPIVNLEKDQELQLVGFARLGKAKNHAKYSLGLVHFRKISDIEVKNSEEAKETLDKLSDSLVNKPKGNVKVGDKYKSSKDEDYIESLVKENSNSIEVKPGKETVFFIESWGQKDPKEIISESVKVLENNLKEFLKAVKK